MSRSGVHLDPERMRLREADISLKEWGRWSSMNGGAGLGYPSAAPYMRVRGADIEDFDMRRVEEVEYAWSSWQMLTLAWIDGHARDHNLMLMFILRIHYCEEGPVSEKIHHTSRKFHTAISRSRYYLLLQEARRKIATLICH